jgi:hypothetical protein
MIRTWTILGVRDVPQSFRWYQSLFGQPATHPAHAYFGQLRDADGTVLLSCTSGARMRIHRCGAPTARPPATASSCSSGSGSSRRH